MTASSNPVIAFLSGLSLKGAESRSAVSTAFLLVIGVAYAALHMIQVQTYIIPAGQMKNIHVAVGCMIVFLAGLERVALDRVWVRRALALALAVTAVVFVYIHVEYEDLVNIRSLGPNTADLWVAFALLVVALYASYLEWGWTIPLLSVLGVVYGLFGEYMPAGILFHGGFTPDDFLAFTSIPNFTGLFGGLTELSVGTIFLFMLFAGVLEVTGGINFILQMAYSIGGRTRAGPAQVAVVGSGLMGMVSGSTVANVAATGAVTIPLMKRFGFRPEFAGAVEAVASTGGQVTPPVMGLAAFLIVGITGIPYTEVMIAAALPALVYYLYLMVAVHIRAVKFELDGTRLLSAPEMQSVEPITFGTALLRFGHLLVAIGVLVYLLVIQMPPGNAAMYSLLVLLVLDALKRLFLARHTPVAGLREAVRVLVQGLESGARSGAQVAVVIAVIGVLVEMLGVTGFAQKLSNAMLELAGGNLAALLVISALACIAFGLGLPTSAAYILVAVLGAPSLREMGVPLLAAHFFVFYYANLSSITPPVAVAAMVAANIAQASYFRTAMISVRLGLPGFLLPFMFVVHPEILGIDTTFVGAVLVAAGALAGVVAFNVAFEGFLLTHLAWWERVMLIPASVGLIFPGYEESIAGTILFAIVGVIQYFKLKRQKAGAQEASA